MNGKIRLITRMAFGFASPEALIALAMLALGSHRSRTGSARRYARASVRG
jgi:hypothetical protein